MVIAATLLPMELPQITSICRSGCPNRESGQGRYGNGKTPAAIHKTANKLLAYCGLAIQNINGDGLLETGDRPSKKNIDIKPLQQKRRQVVETMHFKPYETTFYLEGSSKI